ncbi:MAG: nicotinate-nucleotide adenylyltransferase [Desulfitobacteriaceae bacterium]
MENLRTKMERLGIMGGTFDPIHNGHLVAAETARIEFGLSQVLFIPTGNPPHKLDNKVTAAKLRYKMVEEAIQDNSSFAISRVELDREGPSYTIDTLRQLHRSFPDNELYFITGTDALREIFFWREAGEILRLTHFIAASRPGFEARDFLEQAIEEHPEAVGRIHLLEVPALAISSTDIRARVSRGQSIRYLLPEVVRQFIVQRGLYQS